MNKNSKIVELWDKVLSSKWLPMTIGTLAIIAVISILIALITFGVTATLNMIGVI